MRFSSVEQDTAALAALTTHEADTSSIHGITDTTKLVTTDTTQTISGAKTFSAALLGPSGSAAAPAYAFSSASSSGMYFASSALRWAVSGTQYMSLNTVALAVTGNVVATGGVYSGLGVSGSSISLTGTSPTNIEVTSAGAAITLFQVAWGATATPAFRISDPQRLISGANPVTITPWTGGVFTSNFNSINEADGTNGVWDDTNGGFGPTGVGYASLTTTGGVWQLTRIQTDPGVSGASGGWHLVLISSGGY